MNSSEQINELLTALAKAQGKINPALKDKTNPFFKSSYADLASIWNACRQQLSENGLSVIQTIIPNATSGMSLSTTLGHSSGQWIASEMPIISQKQDPQSIGSAITYYRRYSLAAIVGVVSDEDDDGDAATFNENSKQASFSKAPYAKAVQKPKNEKISNEVKSDEKKPSAKEIENLSSILAECDPIWIKDKMEKIRQLPGVKDISDINTTTYAWLLNLAYKNRDDFSEKVKQEMEASNESLAIAE